MKFIICLAISFLSFFNINAQSKKNIITSKSTRYIQPKVKSFIGKYTNNSVVTTDEAKNILAQPLIITDSKSKTYNIVTYSFIFKRKGVIENEQTGKKEVAYTSVADHFKTTPLPKLWITNINEGGFVKDEEFYFYDIVIKDQNGVNMFAPDLKIKIQ